MPASGTEGRPLSGMERAFLLLDRACSFNGVNTTHLRGPVDEEHLRRALLQVQGEHPFLRVRIEGDPARFVTTEVPPLTPEVRARRGDEDWRAVEEELINRPFSASEGLCRVVLLRGRRESELVISHHHVIADAQSAVIMARGVLSAMDRLARGEAPGAVQAAASLPPALELALRPALPFLRHFAFMTRFFFRLLHRLLVLRPRRLRLERHAPPAERHLRVVHLRLDPDDTEGLAAACRGRGTTVQGALGAALLLACADEDGLAAGPLGFFSAVGMRHLLPPALRDQMGLYISQLTSFHEVRRGMDFWSLARAVRAGLEATLRSGEQFVTLPLIGLFVPRRDEDRGRFARRFDLASPAAIGGSNIGRVELPPRAGAAQVVGFEMAVGPSVVSPLIAAASTFAGTLSLNLVVAEPLVSYARAERLGAAALAALRRAGGGHRRGSPSAHPVRAGS